MTKINDILTDRLKGNSLSKMTSLAERSSAGGLSSFSGVFKIAPLSQIEKDELSQILRDHTLSEDVKGDEERAVESKVEKDLSDLSLLTTEIKAIQAQAVLLHGERIFKAQSILKNYREGAFTAWLKFAYGNRQTPYNFLHYFQLITSIPEPMRKIAEEMPRQAIYALSSRKIDLREKVDFINSYKGESKRELLDRIQEEFPLSELDKRKPSKVEKCKEISRLLLQNLKKVRFLEEDDALSLLQVCEELQKEIKGKIRETALSN